VIIYFHGGGFMAGLPHGYRMFAGQLSRVTGCRVLQVDYRKAPEHRMPAGREDCVEAYYWLLQQQHVDASRVVMMGDSAGGSLVCLTLQFLALEAKVPLPCGAVAFSPWLDLTNQQASRQDNLGRDTTFQGKHDLDVHNPLLLPYTDA